jgi:ankyrin repeat protein
MQRNVFCHTKAQHAHRKVAVNIFMDDKWLDPNLRALREETPLHVCAIYGSPKVCLWLLNAKADPVMKDTNEWTPIHYAARFGHKDVLEMLRREHRSQIEQTIRDSFRSEKALSRPGAAAQGAARTVHDADANTYIDPVTNDHWTPLHVAARFEQTDIITYLLTSGAAKEAKVRGNAD